MKEKKKVNNFPPNGNMMIGVNVDFNIDIHNFTPMPLFNYDTGLVVPIYKKTKQVKRRWK